jgi:hypothetical protein
MRGDHDDVQRPDHRRADCGHPGRGRGTALASNLPKMPSDPCTPNSVILSHNYTRHTSPASGESLLAWAAQHGTTALQVCQVTNRSTAITKANLQKFDAYYLRGNGVNASQAMPPGLVFYTQ